MAVPWLRPGPRVNRRERGHRSQGTRAARWSFGIAGGTIGQRVARILALPAMVVLLLLGVLSAGEVRDYRASQATSRSVELALAVQGLVHELQTERGITAAVLGGNASFREELPPARHLVDQQRAVVDQLVGSGGSAEAQLRSALRQLDGLPAVRSATDGGTAARAAMFSYFTERISALTTVDLGLERSTDAELRRGVRTLQALQDAAEATAQERAFMNGVFSAGGFRTGEFVQFAAMRAARQAAWARFDRSATAAQKASADFVLNTGAARETAHFEQVAVEAADGRHLIVNPQSWWSGLTTVLDDMRQLQEHVGSQIQARAATLQQNAATRLAALFVVVILFFAGSIYLAVLASMAITRPLASMATEADDVAAERLPEAVSAVQSGAAEARPPDPPAPVRIPPRATAEIRSVAHALDRLQSVAYGLATDQAIQRRHTIESLANLGRRNQNLIRRQLGFITSLEREEIDPGALANLFELDHLATRMRRNAASLLVLVGAASPRQWNAPVPVADVIRSAVSEVEEYRRVALRRLDDAAVIGPAVGSVSHLLSELIENGLTFSPPDTEVEVQGRQLPSGYLIAITDQGVGMNPEELQLANSRLRGEGDFIAAPTRFLGHFVVGQLARQMSVDVELVPSPVIGVTARVTLPQSLLSMMVATPAGPAQEALPAAAPSGAAGAAASPQAPHPLPEGDSPATITQIHPAPPAARTGLTAVPGSGAAGVPREPDTPAAGTSTAAPPEKIHPPDGAPQQPRSPREPTPATASDRDGTGPVTDPRLRPARSIFDTGSMDPGGREGPPREGPPRAVPPAATILLRPDSLAPGSEAAAAASSDRTRNGLAKRRPRQARSTEPPETGEAAHRPAEPQQPTALDSSPDQVSARLTAFRSGMQRGQGTSARTTTTAGHPDSTEHAQEQS